MWTYQSCQELENRSRQASLFLKDKKSLCCFALDLSCWWRERDDRGQNKADDPGLVKFDLLFSNVVCVFLKDWLTTRASPFHFFFSGGSLLLLLLFLLLLLLLLVCSGFFSCPRWALLRAMKRNQSAFVSCDRRVQIDWLKTLFLFLI